MTWQEWKQILILKVTLQGVGVNLKQLLVTLNDGKEPTVETAVPISNQGHDPR